MRPRNKEKSDVLGKGEVARWLL